MWSKIRLKGSGDAHWTGQTQRDKQSHTHERINCKQETLNRPTIICWDCVRRRENPEKTPAYTWRKLHVTVILGAPDKTRVFPCLVEHWPFYFKCNVSLKKGQLMSWTVSILHNWSRKEKKKKNPVSLQLSHRKYENRQPLMRLPRGKKTIKLSSVVCSESYNRLYLRGWKSSPGIR